MAKVAFITLYDKGCLGVRYISSYLKRKGHSTSIIYMGRHEGAVKNKRDASLMKESDLWVGINEYGVDLIRSYSDPLSARDTQILLDLLKKIKPDIIAFSLRTMFLDTANGLTKSIRLEVKAPIIYGGIAATCEPERCLEQADMACVGEGEYSMGMLANSLDSGATLKQIKNIWSREGLSISKNAPLPLEQELDRMPFPDYEPEGKFSILNSGLIENDPSIGNLNRFTYEIMTSRGCPFSCSYCCNDLFKSLYAGQNCLRRRSVGNVIEELSHAKEKHNIKSVLFRDEVFTFGIDWVKEFASRYKNEINLPFWCNTHPLFVNEEVLALLKGCGMFSITMGIQSGSENVLYKVFNRLTPGEKIVRSAEALERLKLPLRPRFDMITNNPFETEDDCRKTLELLMRLPKPVNFGLTKLSFIPGTKIMGAAQDISSGSGPDENAYKFWNTLYLLNQYKFFPNRLIRALSRSRFLRERPRVLSILLLPKRIECRYQDISAKFKAGLPGPVLLLLKRIRYALKGY